MRCVAKYRQTLCKLIYNLQKVHNQLNALLKTEDKYYFGQLKKSISSTFLQQNSAPAAIEDWKGEDIVAFQEDLLSRVKARVSEKWFYTYMKNDTDKLPRIDMLNLLSKYAGYENWNHFKASHNTYSKPYGTS